MPKLGNYINLEIYNKNIYFFAFLKQGVRKTNNLITAIGKSAENKYNIINVIDLNEIVILFKKILILWIN